MLARNYALDQKSLKKLEKTLERLRENDYLEEIGYTYTIIPREKSIRWGWN